MRIVIAGSSGLTGTALCRSYAGTGTVIRLVRREPTADDERRWDPGLLADADVMVNLAGAGLDRA